MSRKRRDRGDQSPVEAGSDRAPIYRKAYLYFTVVALDAVEGLFSERSPAPQS